ncbi:MAG: membrane protein insertase YidC [Lachnospiraceae bacterium]|nr:membrane protein insertase YidC [Lachnospiraceae bacterium]
MITAIGKAFAALLAGCYKIIPDYGWSIVFFTLLSKVILIPISVLVQFNSIKMVKMYPEMNRIKAKFYGSSDLISEENYKLYKKENYHPMLDLVPVIVQLIVLMGVVEGLKRFSVDDTLFFGFDLSVIPAKAMGRYILVPLIAAVSAWFMCFIQNKANVLQAEQSKANKYTTMGISVGLSLYLGFFVPAGVALYWTIGNLLAVVQLFILNACISPKKYIDYDALKESRAELDKVEQYQKSAKKQVSKEELAREKQDYKRFFKYGNKQIVFYSEKNGFYKYFKDVIEFILSKTDIVIHYITSDINDEVFALSSDNFRTYYIGENKLIVLMMKMDADMVVMTMPDLQKYQIKRSLIKNDIEYVYMDHGINSLNLVLRKHAIDYFDTIFVANDLVYNEIRAQEKVYELKEKNLVKYGYCLIDNMIKDYENADNGTEHTKPVVLIGPSWQPDNIMDSCIDDLLGSLLKEDYDVIVRPHPQYVRHNEEKLNELRQRYSEYENFTLQTDFSSNSTVFNADIMITDWSGIAYEYSFTTLKPTLFVDTPMKVMNPDYEEIDVVPFDIEIRNKIGISIDPKDCDKAAETAHRLLTESGFSKDSMRNIREQYLYNVGNSAEVGGRYIIKKLIEYSKK